QRLPLLFQTDERSDDPDPPCVAMYVTRATFSENSVTRKSAMDQARGACTEYPEMTSVRSRIFPSLPTSVKSSTSNSSKSSRELRAGGAATRSSRSRRRLRRSEDATMAPLLYDDRGNPGEHHAESREASLDLG